MREMSKLILELSAIRGDVPQFLFYSGVEFEATIKVIEAIREFKKDNPGITEIDFIINSGGGSPDDAYRIIKFLRHSFETLNIIVPFWVKSAASLLSFGGSKIIMGESGEFGALDVQIPKQDQEDTDEKESALIDEIALERIEARAQNRFIQMFHFLRKFDSTRLIPRTNLAQILTSYLAHLYDPLLKQVNPAKIGEKKRMLDIGSKYANRILGQFTNTGKDERSALISYLVNECPSHGYIIDYEMMQFFLPHVTSPEDFAGVSYETKLNELSLYIMKNIIADRIDYIGFIKPIAPPQPPPNSDSNGNATNDLTNQLSETHVQ